MVEVNEAIGRQKGDKSRSTENHKLEQYGPVPSDLRKYCSRRTDDHPTAYQNHIGHFHIFDDPNPDYTLPLVPARIVRVTPALPDTGLLLQVSGYRVSQAQPPIPPGICGG